MEGWGRKWKRKRTMEEEKTEFSVCIYLLYCLHQNLYCCIIQTSSRRENWGCSSFVSEPTFIYLMFLSFFLRFPDYVMSRREDFCMELSRICCSSFKKWFVFAILGDVILCFAVSCNVSKYCTLPPC